MLTTGSAGVVLGAKAIDIHITASAESRAAIIAIRWGVHGLHYVRRRSRGGGGADVPESMERRLFRSGC